jgi:hypothetical protein
MNLTAGRVKSMTRVARGHTQVINASGRQTRAEQIGQFASRNSSRMSCAISSSCRFMVNISRTRACLSRM